MSAENSKKRVRVQVISKRRGTVTLWAAPVRREDNNVITPVPIRIEHGVQWWEGDQAKLQEALNSPLGKRLVEGGLIIVVDDKKAILGDTEKLSGDAAVRAIRAQYEQLVADAKAETERAQKQLVVAREEIQALQAELAKPATKPAAAKTATKPAAKAAAKPQGS